MIALDTHAIIKNLVASGTPENQAEILVATFLSKNEFISVEKERLNLVTTNDLKVAITELKAEIMGVKNELRGEIKEFKTDIKWIMALLIGIFGLLIKSTFF